MYYTVCYIQLFSYPKFNGTHYLTYLLISSAVVVVENLVFLLIITYKFKNRPSSQENSFLLAPLASKQVRIDFQEISHAKINGGIVTIYPCSGKPISTHYNTLDQLQKQLPSNLFYRANRQYIINKQAVHQLTKAENRKLAIQIKGFDSESNVMVSRYKSGDVQRWLQN